MRPQFHGNDSWITYCPLYSTLKTKSTFALHTDKEVNRRIYQFHFILLLKKVFVFLHSGFTIEIGPDYWTTKTSYYQGENWCKNGIKSPDDPKIIIRVAKSLFNSPTPTHALNFTAWAILGNKCLGVNRNGILLPIKRSKMPTVKKRIKDSK